MGTEQTPKWQQRLYTQIPVIGGWLRRRAARALAQDGSPEAVRALAEAVTCSGDAQVREMALEALQCLDTQPSIDAACTVWADTRHADLTDVLIERSWVASEPVAVRVLTALKLAQRSLITGSGGEVLPPLITACLDQDNMIAQEARFAIAELTNRQTRELMADYLCAQWVETRSSVLEDIMVQGRYVASQPLVVRVLSALKTEQRAILTALGADVVEPLCQACEDHDATIRDQARLTLGQLKNPEAREAVCRLVIERDHSTAREAAIEGKYAPRDEYQCALFFFLTEQWARYEVLDFDRRLLRTTYEAADPGLRQRITEKLRAAGKTDFLTIVVEGDYRSRAAGMTPHETEFLVQMLATNREWAKLWGLAFELPFAWSVRIVHVLAGSGWKPETGDERAIFEELGALASTEIVTSSAEMSRFLPPAVQQARARVAGRVNDVAFSPAQPVIAIGTGERKLVLWNFQHAKREQVFSGFARSISCVTFTHDGSLLCGERTNGDVACAIYDWRDGKRFRLGAHDGSVTAVEPIGTSQALAAGRDGKIIVWETVARRKVREQHAHFGARAACVAPDRQQLALGSVHIPGGRLTSLHVSQDGAFMAIGDSDVSMSLWDLRVMDVPMLFGRPLAQALPMHLAPVQALADDSTLPSGVRHALQFLQCVLRHRFRYEIEIEAIQSIRPGDFDIELEEILQRGRAE